MEWLGDYFLQERLGEGAFGSVYLAEHRFIKKPYIVKLLPEEVAADPSFFRRFEEGVAQVASLEHPHIVKIHTVSAFEGRFFVVTEPYFDTLGQTVHLGRYIALKGRSLTEQEKKELLMQVASALCFAHQKGIVHGALKPTNILVRQEEGKVTVALSDVGLRRWLGEAFCLDRLYRRMQELYVPGMRTPPPNWQALSEELAIETTFLAPEQKRVSLPSDGGIGADVYAFGVLAYYVLSGSLPEGRFPLPSKWQVEPQYAWDLLIEKAMHPVCSERPSQFFENLDETLRHSFEEVRERSNAVAPESERQMAFVFPEPRAAKESSAPRQGTEALLKPLLKESEIARPEYDANPGAIFQREMLVSHYVPQKPELPNVEPILTEMVVIPGGTYARGSVGGARDEMPRHHVTLSSFALDIHPVTNEQFVRFLEAMGGEKDQHNNDIIRLKNSRMRRVAGKVIVESGYHRHPIVGVTWYGAIAYAKWIGKRLPTEAEWEATASGGNEHFLYPTGEDIERSLANYFSSDTTAVMSYPPNIYGIYDLAGNVYEWCEDWYAYNYYETSSVEPIEPKGPNQGVYRVLRGGCWKSSKEDLRTSHRHRNNPGAVNGTYGFRCAADVVVGR